MIRWQIVGGRGESWATIGLGIRVLKEEMFGKRRLERFSGSFYCGLPQAICQR